MDGIFGMREGFIFFSVCIYCWIIIALRFVLIAIIIVKEEQPFFSTKDTIIYSVVMDE